MELIDTRTLVAYGLIVVMVASVIAIIAYLRHNTLERRLARQRRRESELRRERAEEEDANTP